MTLDSKLIVGAPPNSETIGPGTVNSPIDENTQVAPPPSLSEIITISISEASVRLFPAPADSKSPDEPESPKLARLGHSNTPSSLNFQVLLFAVTRHSEATPTLPVRNPVVALTKMLPLSATTFPVKSKVGSTSIVIESAPELTLRSIPNPDSRLTTLPNSVASTLRSLLTCIDLKNVLSGSIIRSPSIVEPIGRSIISPLPLICAEPAHSPLVSDPRVSAHSAVCTAFH